MSGVRAIGNRKLVIALAPPITHGVEHFDDDEKQDFAQGSGQGETHARQDHPARPDSSRRRAKGRAGSCGIYQQLPAASKLQLPGDYADSLRRYGHDVPRYFLQRGARDRYGRTHAKAEREENQGNRSGDQESCPAAGVKGGRRGDCRLKISDVIARAPERSEGARFCHCEACPERRQGGP